MKTVKDTHTQTYNSAREYKNNSGVPTNVLKLWFMQDRSNNICKIIHLIGLSFKYGNA